MAKCEVCGKGVTFGIKVSTRTDVPTVLGSPTFAVLRLSSLVLRAISMFALGASVPARLPVQSDLISAV